MIGMRQQHISHRGLPPTWASFLPARLSMRLPPACPVVGRRQANDVSRSSPPCDLSKVPKETNIYSFAAANAAARPRHAETRCEGVDDLWLLSEVDCSRGRTRACAGAVRARRPVAREGCFAPTAIRPIRL